MHTQAHTQACMHTYTHVQAEHTGTHAHTRAYYVHTHELTQHTGIQAHTCTLYVRTYACTHTHTCTLHIVLGQAWLQLAWTPLQGTGLFPA